MLVSMSSNHDNSHSSKSVYRPVWGSSLDFLLHNLDKYLERLKMWLKIPHTIIWKINKIKRFHLFNGQINYFLKIYIYIFSINLPYITIYITTVFHLWTLFMDSYLDYWYVTYYILNHMMTSTDLQLWLRK